jgi:hypothetical protein
VAQDDEAPIIQFEQQGMRFNMRKFAVLIAGAAIAGCTTNPPQADMAAAQQHLAQLLAGKAPGPVVECVPAYHANASSVITPQALAFEPNPGRIYVSSTAGSGCEGVGGPNLSVVSNSHGSSLCAGDVVQIRDLQTGLMAGSCALRPFVPYSRP